MRCGVPHATWRKTCHGRRYDQLAVLAPIMLALTAACPIFKGKLADTDVRCGSVQHAT